MKVAAIDIGTNSFLCLIAEVVGDGQHAVLVPLFDTARVVRLGEKVNQNKSFLPAALDRAAKCLDEFHAIIIEHKVEKVIATATSAARDSHNCNELIKLGYDRGIPIQIIEGEREAQLSYEGAVSGIKDIEKKKVLVVDIGGGSTELVYHEPGLPLNAHSFNVGVVRLTEMFLKKDPVDAREFEALSELARKTIRQFGDVAPGLVIAVAGTPTTLACIEQNIDYDESKVEGYVLTRASIRKMAAQLGALPLTKRQRVRGLDPGRADVIIAGCALLDCALDVAHKNDLRVSTRGLRYGVARHHQEFK